MPNISLENWKEEVVFGHDEDVTSGNWHQLGLPAQELHKTIPCQLIIQLEVGQGCKAIPLDENLNADDGCGGEKKSIFFMGKRVY